MKLDKEKRTTALTVVLSFLMVMTALGFCSSPRSLYVVPVSTALGIGRSVYAVTDTIRFVTTAVVNLFFGSLVTRFGAHRMIGVGFLSLFLFALLSALAPGVALLYVAFFFLGVGLTFTSTAMVGYVVARRVPKSRGTVMGAVLAANGIGGAIATQMVNSLITPEEIFSYRKAYFAVAIVILVVGTLLVAFFRDGDAPEAEKAAAASASNAPAARPSLPLFLTVAVCIFSTGLVLQGVTGVAAAHMTDEGLDKNFIATVLSLHSLAITGSKILHGILYDRFGLRLCTALAMGASVLVMIILITVAAAPVALALAYAVIAALAIPLETVMIPIYTREFFGDANFAKTLGIFVSINTAGYALGAPLINLSYDVFGSYTVAFVGSAILMGVVLVAMQAAISHKRK